MADLDTALACTNAYSDIEEDFFRAGDELSSAESFEVEPMREPRKSLWSRLFERPLRLPSDVSFVSTPPAPTTRPPTERPATDVDDDEWDWMLAVARARARPATSPGM